LNHASGQLALGLVRAGAQSTGGANSSTTAAENKGKTSARRGNTSWVIQSIRSRFGVREAATAAATAATAVSMGSMQAAPGNKHPLRASPAPSSIESSCVLCVV